MDGEPDMLLQKARGGDEAARGELLGSYSRYLTLLARVQIGRRLQGKVDPADVLQDTFLEAHRQFPQFRGTSCMPFRMRYGNRSRRVIFTRPGWNERRLRYARARRKRVLTFSFFT